MRINKEYLRKKLRIPQREIFFNDFESVFDLKKMTFFVQTRVTGLLLQKPPQNGSYTAKLSFTGVLKNFCGN